MDLALERIRVDGGTQPRAELHTAVIEEYAEQMRQGVEFPPVIVFFDGQDYWLADGFHRLAAARIACPERPLPAEVIQGTQVDAQWYSYGVNKTHGLRRTREDKERSIRAALRHPQGVSKSDRDIAHHVGVSHPTVAKLRAELEATGKIYQSPHRTGADGRTINTAKIGRSRTARKSRPVPSDGPHISPRAHPAIHGHTSPVRMVPLQFCPDNPQTAAATLWLMFSRAFLEVLVQDLSHRLSQPGEKECLLPPPPRI